MTWVLLLYFALVGAWTPLLVSFFKAWRERKNPVSLAICLTIFLSAFTNVYLVIALFDKTPETWQAIGYGLCSAAVVIYFYVARHCAAKTFSDVRKS